METFPFFSKVLFQIMIFIITFDLFNLAIFFNYSVLYPYRFQRECLCLCHSSSRCGARSGQRVLDGQTEGLQLWWEAARGRGSLPDQTPPFATGGHPSREGYGPRCHGALPRGPPGTTGLLGMGRLQPWCGVWREVLQGLPWCSWNLQGHPRPHEAA